TIVNGPGAGNLTIDGGGTHGLFYVDTNVYLTISGLTLDHGLGLGGSLYSYYGHVTMTDCIVADGSSSLNGFYGAVVQWYGTMDVERCAFTDNNAYGYGGAISCFSGSATVRDCVFSGNTAGAVAGALFNEFGVLVVTSSTFSDNQSNYGAVLYDYSGTTTFTDCSF